MTTGLTALRNDVTVVGVEEWPLILLFVPDDPARATGHREIWRAYGFDAERTFRFKLELMAEHGLVQRRQEPHAAAGFRWVYWREPGEFAV